MKGFGFHAMNVGWIVGFVRIVFSLAVYCMAFSAFAGSMWFQLNPRNVDAQPLTFKIKSEKTPQGLILFHVDVESKDAVLSRNTGASLTVARGKQQIARVDLKQKNSDDGVRFVFEVAPRYLAQSKFAFKDIEGSGNPWVNDVYWFFLGDFVSEK